MLISLIICTHDRPEELIETLKSLSLVQVPSECLCELIVIQWGSAISEGFDPLQIDDTRTVLPNVWTVQRLDAPGRSKSEAWNLGIQKSRGEIVLFADGDIRFPVTWLESMAQPMLTGDADAVGASVHVVSSTDLSWMTQWIRDYFGETRMTPGPLERMIGPIFGARRAVFEKMSFDPDLGPGSLGFFAETLFGDQLKETGFRLEAVTERVEQYVATEEITRQGLLKRAQALGKSLAYLCHHWEHQQITAGQLRLRMLSAALRLGSWRRKHKTLTMLSDRIDPAEMELAMWYYHYGFYLVERRRPRNYDRHGLVKLRRH